MKDLTVTEQTKTICLTKNKEKLAKNGYGAIFDNRLIDFKLACSKNFGKEIDFPTKSTIIMKR